MSRYRLTRRGEHAAVILFGLLIVLAMGIGGSIQLGRF